MFLRPIQGSLGSITAWLQVVRDDTVNTGDLLNTSLHIVGAVQRLPRLRVFDNLLVRHALWIAIRVSNGSSTIAT